MSFVYDVGISYASDQASIAKRIYDELWKRGYLVFYDRESKSLVGDRLRTGLPQIYTRDCRVCLLLLSPGYDDSEWTVIERESILAIGKPDERPIIPVLVDGPPPKWLGDMRALRAATYERLPMEVAELVDAKVAVSTSLEFGPIANKVREHLEKVRATALSRSKWTRSIDAGLFALPIRLFPQRSDIQKNGVRCASDFSQLAHRKIAVLGRPGSGKSTLVDRIFATSIRQTRFVPVNIRPWDLAQAAPAIREHLMEELHLSAADLGKLEKRSLLLLVFDGLDEQRDPRGKLAQIESLTKPDGPFPSASLLVTCRTEDYPNSQSGCDIAKFSIAPLTEDDRRRFFDEMQNRELAERLWMAFSANPEIAETCGNQFVFLMLVRVLRSGGPFPRTRAEVYRMFLDELLRNWDGQSETNAERLLALTTQIAVRIAKSGRNATLISIDTLTEEMGVIDEDIAALRRHGLLEEYGNASLRFVQRTMQEYLQAKWLYDMGVRLREFKPTDDGYLRARKTWVSHNTARFCLELSRLLRYLKGD